MQDEQNPMPAGDDQAAPAMPEAPAEGGDMAAPAAPATPEVPAEGGEGGAAPEMPAQ